MIIYILQVQFQIKLINKLNVSCHCLSFIESKSLYQYLSTELQIGIKEDQLNWNNKYENRKLYTST